MTELSTAKQALLAGAGSIAAFLAGDAYTAALQSLDGGLADNVTAALAQIPATGLSADPLPLAIGGACACLPWLGWARWLMGHGKRRDGEEHGSARWGTRAEGRAFMDLKDPDNNLIFTRDFGLALKREKFDLAHDRNHNVMVIGGPGSGKTRYYVKPNLMQLNSSYFVTDPKGTMIGDVGQMFADAGYAIVTFDTTDLARSDHYNPLAYVRTQAQVLTFVECLIRNTTGDDRHAGDPFWENAERLLYTALTAYLLDHCPPANRNLNGLMLLLGLAEAREEDESYRSPLDLLFEELETGRRYVPGGEGGAPDIFSNELDASRGGWGWRQVANPTDPEDDFALSNYKAFKVAAGKTLKSIIISCNVRLKPLSIRELSGLLEDDGMHLERLGAEGDRTVVFASMSDTDSTFDFLFALLMWQAMDVLCRRALEEHGGSLPVPVHFVLDEFANIGRVPDFEKMVAVARSRNINISVIVQSASQLERAYEREGAKTIQDCCDTTLFLGGKSTETNEMVSKMVGKQTIKAESVSDSRGANPSTTRSWQMVERDLVTPDEVGRLGRDEAILLISGAWPLRGPKYDLADHPRYSQVDPGHKGADHSSRFDIRAYREGR